MSDTVYLGLRGRTWWYDRKVPADLRSFMPEPLTGKTRYRVNLKTSDLREAQKLRLTYGPMFDSALALARRRKEGEVSVSADEFAELEKDAAWWSDQFKHHGPAADYDLLKERTDQLKRDFGESVALRFWRQAVGYTSVKKLLDQWLASMSHIEDKTRHERRGAILRFSDWTIEGIEKITKEVAREYIGEVLDKLAPGTLTKHISALRLYWAWMIGHGVGITVNPWNDLQLKKGKKVVARNEIEREFTTDEIGRLFTGKPRVLVGDFMLLGLLTGGRLSELGDLRVKDLNLAAQTIFLPGTKTEASPRTIPLHRLLVPLVTRRMDGKGSDAWLFEELPDEASLKGGRGRSALVTQAFERYRRSVGVHEKVNGKRRALVNFHSFRRWMTVKLTEAGTQEVVIDHMLGWKRQGMRARYAVAPDLMKQMRESLGRIEVPASVR